jgi:hypothetical protein
MSTMKKLFAAFLLLLSVATTFAQPAVNPSQLAPHWGLVRKSPCATGNADACGSNPPTYHVTPAMCGILFSTSSARNADNSVSTAGVKFTLPLVSELTAAGYTPAGASPAAGFTNREGQCQVSFVMGAPGPDNYLRVGISGGVQGTDKFTPFAQGAYDLTDGEIVFPYLTPGVITFTWNGTSWLLDTTTPAIAERLGNGQMGAHGQGRLFVVTADPSWWTVDTAVGKLAYCPNNGLGTAANANGGSQLTLMAVNCTFRTPTAGTATEWVGYRNVVSGITNSIAAGAAYGAGTAPNGVAYAAGNYAVMAVASIGSFVSGTTVEVHNIPTTNGTVLEGKWIGKLLTSPTTGCATGSCIELHERVDETSVNASPIGPPSSFVAGDTIKTGWVNPVSFNYAIVTNPASSGARITNASNGVDYALSGSNRDTVIGLVRRVSSAYVDSTTTRYVASYFNPVEKKCQNVFTTDRTLTSTTFVEVNSEIRCNFVYLNDVSAQAASLGDLGRRVRYEATIGAGNGTASDGCEFAVAFDGTTAEAEVAGFVNPSGVSGGRQAVSLGGQKSGLTEASHYITLLARAVTGGTCTVNAATTQLTAYIWQ